MNKKTLGLAAGVIAIAGGSFMGGVYEGSKETMKTVNSIINKNNEDSERAAKEAKRAADASQRAMVAAITTRFSSSAQMCINLGQATPILMRHIQTIKTGCETVDTIHNLITENKKICETALEVLSENEDILGKIESKKEMIQHLEATKDQIKRMEMDPEFPKACKKEKPEKHGMKL